jgi:predicted DCC family thiol-disulfide oxidoreductase YuxK
MVWNSPNILLHASLVEAMRVNFRGVRSGRYDVQGCDDMPECVTDLHQSGYALGLSHVSENPSGPDRIVKESPSIILYDGVCGFCNRFTAFVLARDENDLFRFASLQSQFAAHALGKRGRISNLDTVYVIANAGDNGERVLCKSQALLFILYRLPSTIVLSRILGVVPRRVADFLYNLFARYRYALFGELKACPVPSRAERAKFIES